ncbi:MAG UNVERIFIED_CONTAM: MFS transporter [Rickettsiaceae bacterium]|jgi:MFS family permease
MREEKNIRNYFAADIISQIGGNIAFLSIHWFILEKTNSNEKIGLAALMGVIASLITSPFAGIIADVFTRKTVLIISNLIRAFAIGIVTFLLYTKDFSIYYIYLFFIISGIGFNVYLPAAKAFLQEIIPSDKIVKWSGVLEINVQISMLLAGALSGIIYKIFGIYIILALNIATFCISSLLLYFVDSSNNIKTRGHVGIIREISLGLKYFSTKPIIFSFMLIMIMPHIASICQNIVLPGYVMHHLNSNSVSYGMMSMIYGAGAAVISVIFIFFHNIAFSKALIYRSFIISISSISVLVISTNINISFVAIFFFGFANSAIKIILISTMMRVVDRQFMGRIVSVKNFIITLMQMLCSYNIGLMMDLYGDYFGYILIDAIMILSLVLYSLYSKKFESLFSLRANE